MFHPNYPKKKKKKNWLKIYNTIQAKPNWFEEEEQREIEREREEEPRNIYLWDDLPWDFFWDRARFRQRKHEKSHQKYLVTGDSVTASEQERDESGWRAAVVKMKRKKKDKEGIICELGSSNNLVPLSSLRLLWGSISDAMFVRCNRQYKV